MSFKDNKSVTVLDIKSDKIREQLEFCGNFKKRYIMLMLKQNFPYYYLGMKDDMLEPLINHFKKKYEKKNIENPIFLSWSKGIEIENKTVTLLNIILGGGASEFVEYVLENTIIPVDDIRTLKYGNFKLVDEAVFNNSVPQQTDSNINRNTNTDSGKDTSHNNQKNIITQEQDSESSKYISRTESQFDDD